jgi:hypothetical protein
MSDFPWEEARPVAVATETARLFARVFGTDDGQAVLEHLRELTIERVMGADASDAALRQLEGQRQLVKLMETLIKRGRQ